MAVRFAAGELDALHGRFVHAARDDVDLLQPARRDLDARRDARTLRLRPFGPDDPLAERCPPWRALSVGDRDVAGVETGLRAAALPLQRRGDRHRRRRPARRGPARRGDGAGRRSLRLDLGRHRLRRPAARRRRAPRARGSAPGCSRRREDEARRRGCRQVVLATHTFQAPDFYAGRGYVEDGRVEGYPAGHAQVHLVKQLRLTDRRHAVVSGSGRVRGSGVCMTCFTTHTHAHGSDGAVAGASGYAGGELLRLLLAHPALTSGRSLAGTAAGRPVTELHPQLPQLAGLTFGATDAGPAGRGRRGLPGPPARRVRRARRRLPADLPVVDLGADFRLDAGRGLGALLRRPARRDLGLRPARAARAARARGRRRHRVANPGCYPTAVALGLAPLLAAGLVEPADVVVVAASGTSGRRAQARPHLIGSEVMGALSAYKAGGVHQHTPEMEQALTAAAGPPVTLSFTPVLAPMPRGILATSTAASRRHRRRGAARRAARGVRRRAVRPRPAGGHLADHRRDRRQQQRAPAGRRRRRTPAGRSSSPPSTTWSRAPPARRCRTPTSSSASTRPPASSASGIAP